MRILIIAALLALGGCSATTKVPIFNPITGEHEMTEVYTMHRYGIPAAERPLVFTVTPIYTGPSGTSVYRLDAR